MRVLGMGNALVDVLAVIQNDDLLREMNLPKGSMQLIDKDRFEKISEKIKGLNAEIVSGGSASNTIVGLSRLGVRTGFIGRVGQDSFGKYYRNDLIAHKVTPLLSEVDEISGVASTFISQDGERTFGTYLGAAALLGAEDLNERDFNGYDYFYIEGYLVQSYDLIRKALSLAKNAGLKTILDFASYNVVEDNREFLLEIIPQYVDIIFANEEEAKALYDVTPEEAVAMLAKEVELAIVKTGSKGSWVQRGEEKVFVPAHKVDCVDTTGAGDLYASGFIYGLTKGFPLNTCAQIGTLLAANVIQRIGAKIPEEKWQEVIPQISQIILETC